MNVTTKILERDDDTNKPTKENVVIVEYTDNLYDEAMREEVNYRGRK
jgi:hypothetical protein